ncbi:hypothetical protein CHELA40_11658 [Chelatococcus asaccharovorans]|nr:hypothetical protein CHELA40_11658 [Chelatococcus asaccharovorans]CAH1684327.1 hypothetical protein CHELA17_63944 [Chelatococcus asaccharovorans]
MLASQPLAMKSAHLGIRAMSAAVDVPHVLSLSIDTGATRPHGTGTTIVLAADQAHGSLSARPPA